MSCGTYYVTIVNLGSRVKRPWSAQRLPVSVRRDVDGVGL